MFLFCVLAAALLAVASIFWIRTARVRLPPGPRCLPLLGYLPWLDPEAPHESLAKLSERYGPMYGLYLGGVYAVVLADHRLIRKLFAKEATSGRAPLYLTFGIMKGYGLICAEKELWKNQRRFVSGYLKHMGVSKYGPKRGKIEGLIKNQVVDFIEYVEDLATEQASVTLDPLEPLRHNLGSVMNLLVFGKSWSRDDELWKWLQHLQEEGTKLIGVAGPLNFLPFLRFLPKYKKTMAFLLEGKAKTHQVYHNIIKEQADFDKDNLIRAFLLEREKTEGTDDRKFFSDEQFCHLLADIFGAGLDTTLTTLRWFLLYMACNPLMQSKVQHELDAILHGAFPSLDDLPNLHLTQASLAETQRIRPVVPVGIPHGALEEVQLDGYKIPKGSMIIPLQWRVHMNPENWEKPERFEPARFLDEEGKFVKPEAFIPFQTGKRMCVGDELAKMLLFLFGAAILQKFSISTLEGAAVDLKGECGITLTPKAHELVFTVRQKQVFEGH